MELVIIRHGQTPGNAERRYVGSRNDEPLSDEGRAQACKAARLFEAVGFERPSRVYVTGLVRTQQTAAILFPQAEQVVIDGVEEMDFGVFSGRSADEMADDVRYREWVEGMCEGVCPEGESKTQFDERVCAAMEAFLRAAIARGDGHVVMVAHGGTVMAFLSRFAGDASRSYYDWLVGNCQGYRMQVGVEPTGLALRGIERILDA